ncbi:MAG: hypothetical protein FJZ66_02735 [Bacteroidetes bacterium]|nr:hypothetical protein [Bacteroidota bacterium]
MLRKDRIVAIVLISIVLCTILFFYWKSNDNSTKTLTSEKSNDFDYYQFKPFNLTKYEINATILLPDETAGIGTAFTPEMTHEEGSHLWQLQLGRNFIIHIEDLGELTDVFQEFKQNLQKSSAFTISSIVDSDSLIVYGRSLSKQYQKENKETFHIFAVKYLDGRCYQFRNKEEGNTKTEILFMQKSIESIK